MTKLKTFTLKEDKATGEPHLFESSLPSAHKGKCVTGSHSICGKMEGSEHAENIFSCASAKQTRQECAEIGERVCGDCVSFLYASY